MATGEDPKKTNDNFDDLLKCTICLEIFKVPKFLPCLHTFCKSCIRAYIDSFKDKKGEIPCPVCRQPIVDAENVNNAEVCVNRLPVNNFVVSMLDKKSIEKSEKLCDSCEDKSKAVTWCSICEEAFCERCMLCHKKFKMTSKHELIPIADIQNQESVNISKVVFCDDHRESAVQVYCVDHEKVCCTLCATLSHRKCDKVISIEEATDGIKQNENVTNLLSKLQHFEEFLTDVISGRNESDETFESETTKIETFLTKMVKEMKDHLDRTLNKILGELDATKKQNSIKVTDDINDLTSFKSAVSNWKIMLAGVVKHGSEQQCLVIFNEIAPRIEKLQNKIKDALQKMINTTVRFDVSTIAKDFNEKVSIGELKIGETKLKYEKGNLNLIRTDFRNGQIKIIRTIDLALDGEISGIFLGDEMLLFSASTSQKVVKYSENGEILGELSMPTYPNDLCLLSEQKVVVSSSGAKVLYMVNSEDMTLFNTMKLSDVPVYSVCVFDNNQFLIGSYCQLTWVNQSSGTKVKSVKTAGYSWYVSTSGERDFCHRDGDSSVCNVVNDEKKFTYTNKQLSRPIGIGRDDEGNFYVAGNNSGNIHQITDNGELIRIIPASAVGVKEPMIVRFKRGTNLFLVTSQNPGKSSLCSID